MKCLCSLGGNTGLLGQLTNPYMPEGKLSVNKIKSLGTAQRFL